MQPVTLRDSTVTHYVVREYMGAVAYFACGGWAYWAQLRRGAGGEVCKGCAKSPQIQKSEAVSGQREMTRRRRR